MSDRNRKCTGQYDDGTDGNTSRCTKYVGCGLAGCRYRPTAQSLERAAKRADALVNASVTARIGRERRERNRAQTGRRLVIRTPGGEEDAAPSSAGSARVYTDPSGDFWVDLELHDRDGDGGVTIRAAYGVEIEAVASNTIVIRRRRS